jgi:NitT/TauT family transport system substrate-binding protein
LYGKNLLVENTSVGKYLLSRALELNGMSDDSVKIVSSTVDMHMKIVLKKDIDAVVSYDPYSKKLLKIGYEEIFSSKKIPYEIVDVLIIRNNVLKEKENYVKELIQGYFKSIDLIKENDTKSIKYLQNRMGLNETELKDSIGSVELLGKQENFNILLKDKVKFSKMIENIESIMLRNNILYKRVYNQNILGSLNLLKKKDE